jgi:hypothetical protein
MHSHPIAKSLSCDFATSKIFANFTINDDRRKQELQTTQPQKKPLTDTTVILPKKNINMTRFAQEIRVPLKMLLDWCKVSWGALYWLSVLPL